MGWTCHVGRYMLDMFSVGCSHQEEAYEKDDISLPEWLSQHKREGVGNLIDGFGHQKSSNKKGSI